MIQLDLELLDLERRYRLREEEEEDTVKRRGPQIKTVWTRPWILCRPLLGTFDQLVVELNREDVRSYSNFMRIDADIFGELVGRIQHKIQKEDTHLRRHYRQT